MQVDAAEYCQYDFLMTRDTDCVARKQSDAQLLLSADEDGVTRLNYELWIGQNSVTFPALNSDFAMSELGKSHIPARVDCHNARTTGDHTVREPQCKHSRVPLQH